MKKFLLTTALILTTFLTFGQGAPGVWRLDNNYGAQFLRLKAAFMFRLPINGDPGDPTIRVLPEDTLGGMRFDLPDSTFRVFMPSRLRWYSIHTDLNDRTTKYYHTGYGLTQLNDTTFGLDTTIARLAKYYFAGYGLTKTNDTTFRVDTNVIRPAKFYTNGYGITKPNDTTFAVDTNLIQPKQVGVTPRALYYTRSGMVSQVPKVLADTFSVSTATNAVIDYTFMGYTRVLSVQVIASRNTTVVEQSPQVSLVAFSNTQCTINLTQANASLVSVLGFNVLQGTALIAANNLATIKLHVVVVGY